MPAIPTGWDQRPPPKLNPRTYAFFRPDRKSFQEFILSEQMRDPTTEVARDIMALARTFTPRSSDADDTDGQHMQDQYNVVREGGTLVVGDSFPYPRVMVIVENLNGGSAAVEFGNSRSRRPGRRMLARAGAAFGDFKGGKG